MKQVGFRGRLFAILLFFALVPSVLLALAWGATSQLVLPYVGATAAWDSASASGRRALGVARAAHLNQDQLRALDAHQQLLTDNLVRSTQARFVVSRVGGLLGVSVVLSLVVLGLVASRVAGHLSRNLSRPLQELVGWTERIGRGEPLPDGPPRRGAPEFAVLRERMRMMSAEIELGRKRAVEAERAMALRESARQVAHELKNPLTPIRFAVARLRRDAPPELAETVEVLAVESQRLEEMARSFSQFGRLPEGPTTEIDVGELVRYTARATVPSHVPLEVRVADGVPMIRGHYDALARALSNVVINAVEACREGGAVVVSVSPGEGPRGSARQVVLEVADSGCGIAPDELARIWEPYVTHKPGGTGLGLAIVRQTVLAHHGTVEAESDPGSGTRIRFILPADGAGAGET